MTSEEGAFYSALDADSDGEEGKFYCWQQNEFKAILDDEANLMIAYYNLTPEGNW